MLRANSNDAGSSIDRPTVPTAQPYFDSSESVDEPGPEDTTQSGSKLAKAVTDRPPNIAISTPRKVSENGSEADADARFLAQLYETSSEEDQPTR